MTGPVLDDGEVLRTPADKRTSSAMPRHDNGRRSGAAPKPPVLWNHHDVIDGGEPAPGVEVFGQLPRGFLSWAYGVLGLTESGSEKILHVCSGALGRDTRGIRIDIRRACRPDVVADGRRLPFADATFDAVVIDPPYSLEYAEGLYGVEYPRPSALLREAARVLRPSGLVGMLHFIVPMPVAGLRFVAVRGVTTGCGYRIRAFTTFAKDQESLFEGANR